MADLDVKAIAEAVRVRHLAAGIEPLPVQPIVDVISRCLAESAVKTEARYNRLKRCIHDAQPPQAGKV